MKHPARWLSLVALALVSSASAAKLEVEVSPVPPGPDAPLQATRMRPSAFTFRRGTVVLLDDEGHVGVSDSGGEALVLPFSEPMVDATLNVSEAWQAYPPLHLVCGRTKTDGLECLSADGAALLPLFGDPEGRKKVSRLRVTSFAGRVKQLLPMLGNCLKVGREALCLERTRDRLQASPAPAEAPWVLTPFDALRLGVDGRGARCSLTAKQTVQCEGTQAYGLLGNGAQGLTRARSEPAVTPPVAQVVAGDGFFCARTASGEAWCWGVLPGRAPRAAAPAEHYPLCPFDRAETERAWEVARAQWQKGAEACRSRPASPGPDACLMGPPVKQLHFDRATPCEQPAALREEDLPREPSLFFSTTPTRLSVGAVEDLAVFGRRLCLLVEHRLQCFTD